MTIKPMTEIEISRAISTAKIEGRLEGLSMAMSQCSGRHSARTADEMHMALTILHLHALQKLARCVDHG